MMQGKLYCEGELIAEFSVEREANGHYWGHLDGPLGNAAMEALFLEFESIVGQQVLSLVDEIERQIDERDCQLVLTNGENRKPISLHIYPTLGEIAFY